MVETVSLYELSGHVIGVVVLTALFMYCILLVASFFSFKKAWQRFTTKTAALITIAMSIFPSMVQVAGVQ